MIRYVATVFITVLMALLPACAPDDPQQPMEQVSPLLGVSPVPSETESSGDGAVTPVVQTTPRPSRSAMVGRVVSTSGGKPLSQVVVRLARVFWGEQGSDGLFVLETASSPGSVTDADGTFFFPDIDPGEYVVIVGDVEAEHTVVEHADGSARVFTAVENDIVDVGTLEVTLRP